MSYGDRPVVLSSLSPRRILSRCMDAFVVRILNFSDHNSVNTGSAWIVRGLPRYRRLTIFGALIVVIFTGCEGRNLSTENAVFSSLPPRRSLVNNASRKRESIADASEASDIVQVSSSTSTDLLRGNTVVAEVNGRPIFVDDIAGSIRLTLQAEPQLTDSQRQELLRGEIKKRLDQRVDEEIVLHALQKKLPEEQRDSLKEHLASAFEDYLVTIRENVGGESDEQFEQVLAQQGMSVPLLREAFFRIQMVNGFVETLSEQKMEAPPGRPELLEYYQSHKDEFTPEERLRWQEIRISKSEPDATKRMADVVRRVVNDKADFGEVARKYSDSTSAEDDGNKGWLTRGALTDKSLEEELFSLRSGEMTRVLDTDRYYSIYRVARHEFAQPRPFGSVQDEIKEAMQVGERAEAKKKVIEELRSKASVRTIFDDDV